MTSEEYETQGEADSRESSPKAAAPTSPFRPYWFWLMLAFALAILHLFASLGELGHGLHAYDLHDDLCQRVARFWQMCGESNTGASEQGSLDPADVLEVMRSIDRKVHPAPTPLLAAVQVLAVIAISFLWFYAFSLRASLRERRNGGDKKTLLAWWPVAGSLVPVMLFVGTMFQAYQPAVFVMALVAIIVAAEHYSGLQTQEDKLDDQRKDLGRQARVLANTRRTLMRQVALLTESRTQLDHATRELMTVKGHTERMLDNEGLKDFIQDVYRAYSNASEVRAVVRLHDIDEVWWTHARKATSREAWAAYFDDAKRERRGAEHFTLAAALHMGQRRRLDATFVTDLPLPLSPEWKRREDDGAQPFFQDLLGLCWQLIVLDEARGQPGCQVSAWVSRPLAWLHATDQRVFQVVRREPREKSSVLTIANVQDAQEMNDPAAEEVSLGIVEWAQGEIRRYVETGSRAEEYLASVLRFALVQLAIMDGDILFTVKGTPGAVEVVPSSQLERVLNFLGLERWLASASRSRGRAADIVDDKLKMICLELFACQLWRMARSDRAQEASVGLGEQLVGELM